MSQPLEFGVAFEVVTPEGVIWRRLVEGTDTPTDTVIATNSGEEFQVRRGFWTRGRSGMTMFVSTSGEWSYCTVADAVRRYLDDVRVAYGIPSEL